jgi:Na+-transporting methylmalonyl-CoA/oxaloacetate decarboxylase gamma subunit
LTISLIGLGLTFAALGLLILVMVLLERLTRHQTVPWGSTQTQPAASPPARHPADEDVVAAIVIALAHVRSLDICQGSLGSTLEVGPGPWWRLGQSHQLSWPGLKRACDGVAYHESDL